MRAVHHIENLTTARRFLAFGLAESHPLLKPCTEGMAEI